VQRSTEENAGVRRAVRRRLGAIVDVRAGEGRTVLAAAGTLFLLIAGHTVLETARDALFLGRLPPSRLSIVYVSLAALGFAGARWNARFVQRFGRRNALIFSLMAAACGTTGFYLLPATPAATLALYVWSGLAGTLVAVQFWMLAGRVFTVTQGKRLFGIVGAGGVLGATAGAGSAAAVLMVAPVQFLLVISAVVFMLLSFLLTMAPRDHDVAPWRVSETSVGVNDAFTSTTSTTTGRYVRRLGLMTALATAALLATDYLFKSAAARAVPPEALGVFLARTYTVLNAIALGVQLFVAGLLVRRLGVVSAMVVLPLLLIAGAGGVVLAGGALAAVLVTRGVDGALRHSVHRVAGELLWAPVPERARTDARAVVDSVVARGAQAATAGVVLVLALLGFDTPQTLAAIIGVLALAWVGVAASLDRPYLDLFRSALTRFSRDDAGPPVELDLRAVEVVVESLSSRDAGRVIAAIDVLAGGGRTRLIPALILYHEAEAVLLRALAVVATRDRRDWIPLAERLLGHESAEVRVAAVRALAAAGQVATAGERLQDIAPSVRAHAAFHLVHHEPAARPAEDARIAAIIQIDGEAAQRAHTALLDAIREHGDASWNDVVLALARTDDPEIFAAAARAMAHSPDPRYVPMLVARLGTRRGRSSVREALVGQGAAGFAALVAAVGDPATDRRVRLHIPRTLSRFGTEEAAARLVDLVEDRALEGAVRYKALRGLGRLVAEQPVRAPRSSVARALRRDLVEHVGLLSLRVPIARRLDQAPGEAQPSGGLLVGLLCDKAEQAAERAFRLLQITHRGEDILSVWAALHDGGRGARAQALEFVDALTRSDASRDAVAADCRALLQIVADDLPDEERVRRAAAFVASPPVDHAEALARLANGSDDALAALAADVAARLGVSVAAALGGGRERARQESPAGVTGDPVHELRMPRGSPHAA
jgi:AAA family ATP:ADP antiporter